MAVSIVTHGTPSSNRTVINTDCDETEDVVYTGASVIRSVEINNTANSAATYVKLHTTDAAGTDPGTTAPDMVLVAPASASITYTFPQGVSFANRICLWAVTAAGTGGATGPTSTVTTRILIQV